MERQKSLSEKITDFRHFFTTITKEESDFIEEIIKWDDGKKLAFIIAKRLFEDKE